MTFTEDHKTADVLVLVDVQNAFISGEQAVPDHVRLQGALRTLLDNARAAKVLIVFLQNDGSPETFDDPHTYGWELFFPAEAGEVVIRKSQDDGFEGTRLRKVLAAHGVRSLAICGMLSEMCLAATARTALKKGFSVILPHDGHATYDVPAGPGGSEGVPARMAARAAEWSLGDEIILLPAAADVCFKAAPYPEN